MQMLQTYKARARRRCLGMTKRLRRITLRVCMAHTRPFLTGEIPLMKRPIRTLILLFAIPTLSFPTVGCSKKATCANFLDKMISCTKNEKAKKFFVGRQKSLVVACEEDLANAEKVEWTKKELDCVTKNTCEEFDACAKGISKQRREARLPKTIAEMQQRIEKQLGENKFAGAIDSCYYNSTVGEATTSANPAVKTAAQNYYKYCLDNIPAWLGKVRDLGKSNFIGLCVSGKTKPKAGKKPRLGFFDYSNASEKQRKSILDLCEEVKFAGDLARLKESTKKETKYLPYQCSIKNIQKEEATQSEGKRKMVEQMKDICFHQIGYPLLEASKAKLMKQKKSYRFCGYADKQIATAFKELKLGKSEQEETLTFFYTLCKLN